MNIIFYIFSTQFMITVRTNKGEIKQGTRSRNKRSIDGGTAFYSDVGPGARIFIGAPFRRDRRDDDLISVRAPPIRGCE